MSHVIDVLDAPVRRLVRVPAYDRVRGLAIVLMVLDHAVLIGAGPDAVRWTLGRLAMPLFMLVAGLLVSSPRWRWVRIAGVGLVLTALVPWAGQPNILLAYALGALVVWSSQHVSRLWLLVALLTVAANVSVLAWSAAAVALMLLGRDAGPWLVRVGDRLPRWLEPVGRHPLGWYLGHLAVFELLRVVVL